MSPGEANFQLLRSSGWCDGLQVGNLRYGRVKLCATAEDCDEQNHSADALRFHCVGCSCSGGSGTRCQPSAPKRISRSTNSQITSFLWASDAGRRLSSCRTNVDAPPSLTIEAKGCLSSRARCATKPAAPGSSVS